MGNLSRYSGLVTKIRAMESRLITHEDVLKLSAMQTTSEFVAYLKQHESYRMLFGHLNEHNLHRSEIESILTNSKYNEYAKIYRFASVKQRRFLDVFFCRFEIDILKTCLRMLFDERDVSYNLLIFESFFTRHSPLDIRKIKDSVDIHDFINHLYGTPYYAILKELNGSQQELFDYENKLDVYYYTYYWNILAKTLHSKERQLLAEELGQEIDLYNLLSLFRLKSYFRIDSASLYSYLVPIHYKLKKQELLKIIEASTPEEMLSFLKQTYYYKHYPRLIGPNPDQCCRAILRKTHTRHVRQFPYSMAAVTNYLYLCDLEIRALTTTLECIRYQLSPAEALNYLQTGGV